MQQKSRSPDLRPLFRVIFFIGIVVLLVIMALPSASFRMGTEAANSLLQTSHGLAAAMFQYSTDNNGNFPDGESSTEVFQKKLYPEYLTNPGYVFVNMAGKTKPADGQPLKPENVGYDVTGGINSNTPENLPLVFTTGYKVSYTAGQPAVPLGKSPPVYGGPPLTWSEWWQGRAPAAPSTGLAVGFKDMSSAFFRFDPPDTQHPNGSVSNIIRGLFDPNGQTYRQLTPDGSLSGN